jgi:hypothetical protein
LPLAAAKPGTAPERIALDLITSADYDLMVVAHVVDGALEAAGEIDEEVLYGLRHVLARARKATGDLCQVLHDAHSSERPLSLKLREGRA